ncbi:hypothetical protein ACI8AG_09475 [Blastococcus sp. SYSU DS0552]
MSVDVQQRPGTAERPVVGQRPAVDRAEVRSSPPAEKRGPEYRGWLCALDVVVAATIVFTAMIVLTMLAGGDGYLQ